jgi:hypothetical protein
MSDVIILDVCADVSFVLIVMECGRKNIAKMEIIVCKNEKQEKIFKRVRKSYESNL